MLSSIAALVAGALGLIGSAAPPPTIPSDTSTYETPALEALVRAAVQANRRVPEALGGYRARLESEISIGTRRTEGMEMAVQLEQVASELTWDRSGQYEQRVIGYRSQAVGASFATLGFFRVGWAVPSLYGNRLALSFGRDSLTDRERARRSRDIRAPRQAVHPLAEDRERYYRFSGGDTVVTLQVDRRTLPVATIRVDVRDDVPERSVVFVGDLHVDVTRNQLVGMRGHFAVVGGPKSPFDLLRDARLSGIAYIETVSAEVDGQFWLPIYQRFEAHAEAAAFGESRAIFRIITRYRDRRLTPAPPGVVVGAAADTLRVQPFRLEVASRDTLAAFSDWQRDLGEESAEVSADDFVDVAPDRWSPVGGPRLTLETERFTDALRTDRVQGVFTGTGVALRFRDAAPGLRLRALAGYAWSEQALRGRVEASLRRGRSEVALRALRSLDITNDFRNPYDSGSTVQMLLGRDDYDYVDRRHAGVQFTQWFGVDRQTALRVHSGPTTDRGVMAALSRSPLGFGEDFRPVRAVTDGTYWLNAAVLEWNPDVSLEFLRTGFGARFAYERGDGELAYQRAELRVTARTNRGPITLGARLDVGVTTPDAPPQQLFELGENQNLPGYAYKEFAGDQAAVLRGVAAWRFDVLDAPIRLTRSLWLPPVAPTLALAVQAGHARASTADARTTVQLLGSAPTGHIRSSAALTLRGFGQAVGVGVARPLDSPGGWRWIVEFGQRF